MKRSEATITLPNEFLVALSRPTPVPLLLLVLTEWLVIAVTLYLATHVLPWWCWPLVVFLIASRQHGLAILGHDFAHHRFSRNRSLNDTLGDLFCTIPIGGTIASYRAYHFEHHRHTGTERDPNWVESIPQRRYAFPMSIVAFVLELIKAITLISLPQFMKYDASDDNFWKVDRGTKLRSILFLAGAAACITFFHVWWAVLCFWIMPLLTIFPALYYLRYAGEHHALPEAALSLTRTVRCNWFERVFLLPHSVSLHTEPHLYPSVPCVRLPALHELLCRNPDYRQRAAISKGYFSGVLREFARHASKATKPLQPAKARTAVPQGGGASCAEQA